MAPGLLQPVTPCHYAASVFPFLLPLYASHTEKKTDHLVQCEHPLIESIYRAEWQGASRSGKRSIFVPPSRSAARFCSITHRWVRFTQVGPDKAEKRRYSCVEKQVEGTSGRG